MATATCAAGSPSPPMPASSPTTAMSYLNNKSKNLLKEFTGNDKETTSYYLVEVLKRLPHNATHRTSRRAEPRPNRRERRSRASRLTAPAPPTDRPEQRLRGRNLGRLTRLPPCAARVGTSQKAWLLAIGYKLPMVTTAVLSLTHYCRSVR
jgi:hypothetical protein